MDLYDYKLKCYIQGIKYQWSLKTTISKFNEEISFCIAYPGTLIIDGTLLPSGFIHPIFCVFPCSPKLNVQLFPKDMPPCLHACFLSSYLVFSFFRVLTWLTLISCFSQFYLLVSDSSCLLLNFMSPKHNILSEMTNSPWIHRAGQTQEECPTYKV